MIKLEMHLHSVGGSDCAKETPETIIEIYKKAGYGGMVLTNHYGENHFQLHAGESKKEKLNGFCALYKDFKQKANAQGLKTFFGAEVTAFDPEGYFSEYLLYGLTEKILYNAPYLHHLTQRQLFDFANANGLFMAQSHPFRKWVKCGFYDLIHGVETYNGHTYHDNNNEVAFAYANAFNKTMISGTDFHAKNQTPVGGILLPDGIETDSELAEYLLNNQPTLIIDGKIQGE